MCFLLSISIDKPMFLQLLGMLQLCKAVLLRRCRLGVLSLVLITLIKVILDVSYLANLGQSHTRYIVVLTNLGQGHIRYF